MIEVVELCLKDSVSPEVFDTVEHAMEIMDRAGINDYVLPYEEIASLGDNMDSGDPQRAMIALTNGYIDALLQGHSVEMVPECPLSMKTCIVEGLLAFDDYEDAQAVVDAVTSAEDSVEALAQALELVTRYKAEEIMPWFEQVSWALVRRLGELASRNIDREVDVDEVYNTVELRKLLIELWEVLGKPNNPFMEYIGQGVPLGLSFNIYASMLKEHYESMPPSALAIIFMLMARVSEEGQENILTPISANIDLYLHDVNQITSVDIILRDLFVKYTQHVEARLLSERVKGR